MSEYIYDTSRVETQPEQGFTGETVVRCRDCECFDDETSLCNRLGKFPEWHACTEPDGFCKWAERRQP